MANQTLPYPQQNMSTEYVNRWRKPGDENRTNIPRLMTMLKNIENGMMPT
ncbi:MAG: hypothetical protein ACLU4J_22110 [Butyricimonas paravirosa]